ncbi:MAG: class I SAM-dependent methyltransferase [Gaiellaceae bacterium]
MWSTGDYADVCDRMIPELGARLVELADVQRGDEVLDVAAGTGNAALPAAKAGAAVTALDITPSLLEIGSRRAKAAGLRVEWVAGDAHALPFAAGSFDRVLSCVGVQFCADHDTVASELARVCRPGGCIALIAWTREGFIGQILASVAKATGGSGAQRSPLDWGSEDKVTELFREHAADMATHREHVEMRADSAEGWVDYMAMAYGPLARARTALDGRGGWEPVRARLVEIADAHADGGAAAFAARAEYLTTLLRR